MGLSVPSRGNVFDRLGRRRAALSLQQRGSLSLTGSEVRELRALLLLCCFDGKVSPLTSLACSGAAHAIRQGVCSNV